MADRQQFTDEQLNTIRESDEFKKFQESKEEATVEDYLSSNEAYTFWAEKLLDGQGKDSSEASHEYEGQELDDATHDAIRDYQMQMDGRISEDEGQAKKFTPHEYEAQELNDETHDAIREYQMKMDGRIGEEEGQAKKFTPHEYEGQELDDETHDAIREYQMKMDGRIGEEEAPAKNQTKGGLTIDENTTENSNENLATAVMNDTDTVWGGDDDDDLSEGEKDVLTVTGVTKEQYKEMSPQERSDLHQEAARIRSANSDTNEFIFNVIELQALQDMKVISPELYDSGIKNPKKALEILQQKRPLKNEEKQAFDAKVTDILLSNSKLSDILPPSATERLPKDINLDETNLIEIIPPSVLAEQYGRIKGEYTAELANDPEGDHKAKEAQLKKLGTRIDNLTLQYYSGVTPPISMLQYNFDDNTNIADVYDGYTDMLKARYPDVSKEQQNIIDAVQTKLDKDFNSYMSAWNLDQLPQKYQDGDEKQLGKMADNLQSLEEQMKHIELSQDTLQWLQNIQFLDDKGNIEPQITEVNGKLQIIPDSKLQTMVDFARTNTQISQLASGEKISDAELQSNIEDRLKIELFSLDNVEKTLNGIAEEKEKFVDPKYLGKFKAELQNPNKPLTISDAAFNKSKQISVNNINACIHQIAKFSGTNSPIPQKLHAPIAKHDEQPDRFNQDGSYNVSFWKTAGYTFGSSLASKAATFGVVKGATAFGYSLSMATAAGGAAVGLSAVGMVINYKNYKKEMEAKKQKATFTGFLTTAPYAAMNVSSTLGFVAGAALMTGHPEVAAVAGGAALAVMGYTTYKDARKHGLTKRQAAKQVAKRLGGMVLGGAAGSFLSSYFGNQEITPASQDSQNTQPEVPQITEPQTVVDYDALNQDAQRYLFQYDRVTPEGWDNYMQQVDAYNAAHPDAPIQNPALLMEHAINSGMIGADGDAHTLYGPGWQADHNVPADAVSALKGLINADGSINENAVDAYNKFNFQDRAGLENFVGKVSDPNIEIREDLYPTKNPHSTYSDMHMPTKTEIPDEIISPTPPETPEITPETNQTFALGYWEPVKGTVNKLKKRIGALADKVTGKNPAGKGAEVDAPVPGGKGTEKLGDNITKKPGKDKDPTPPNNGGSGKGLEVGGIVPPAPGKDKEKGPTPDNPNLAALQGDNVFYEDTSGDVAYNEVEGLNKDEAKKEGVTVAGVTKEEKAPVSKEQAQEKTVSKEDSKKEAPKKETEQKKSPQVSLMTPTGMIPILTQEQETTGRKEEPKEKISEEKPKKKSLFGRLFGGSKRTKEEAPKKETEQKKSPQVSLMTPTGMIPVLVQDTTGKTEAAFKEAAKTTEKETVKKSKWRSFSVARALGNLKDRVGQWQEKRAAEKEQARKDQERINRRKNFDYDKAEIGEFTMNAVDNENPNLQAGDVQAAKENSEQSKTGAVKERKAEVEARKAGQQLSNEELMAAMSGNTGGAYDANQEEKPAQAPAKAGKETTLEERLMMMHNQDYTK